VIRIPFADIYPCEGKSKILSKRKDLLSVWIKKKFNKKAINIELVGDETFMVLENTPKEMRKSYPWYVNLAHKIVMREIDGAIAVSKIAEESIKKYLNIPSAVVNPYIEDARYRGLASVSPDLKNYSIVSVGDARVSKGMDILVKAFEIVKKEFKDAELFIVGKGHPKDWERIEGVHVLGYVEDLASIFERCSLFVQSSRFDTFPVATLEALRSGLPSIVTERTGTKEVVEKLRKDFVRKVDAEDIAKGILKYFDLSEDEKLRLSEKARKLSEPFNKKEMCEKFKEKFWRIVENI